MLENRHAQTSLQDQLHGLNILYVLHAACASKAQQQLKLSKAAEVLDAKFLCMSTQKTKLPNRKFVWSNKKINNIAQGNKQTGTKSCMQLVSKHSQVLFSKYVFFSTNKDFMFYFPIQENGHLSASSPLFSLSLSLLRTFQQ